MVVFFGHPPFDLSSSSNDPCRDRELVLPAKFVRDALESVPAPFYSLISIPQTVIASFAIEMPIVPMPQ